ncbi:hypothetical protein C6501_08010 [Candidatus Poribacteria bacterium]|nr:MAG: hypothetical protein C6501_08010 [Candidatus Poribacteria bacterium]
MCQPSTNSKIIPFLSIFVHYRSLEMKRNVAQTGKFMLQKETLYIRNGKKSHLEGFMKFRA